MVSFTKDHWADVGFMGLIGQVRVPKLRRFLLTCPGFSNRGSLDCFAAADTYLNPAYKWDDWWVRDDADVERLGAVVREEIVRYTIPFLTEYGVYDRAVAVFASPEMSDQFSSPRRVYPHAAALWLNGDHEEAIRRVKDDVALIERWMSDPYKKWAQHLLPDSEALLRYLEHLATEEASKVRRPQRHRPPKTPDGL